MILVVPLGKGPYFRATRLRRCTLFFCPNLLSLVGKEGFSGEHFCPAWLRASYPPPNSTTSFRNHASLESLQCRHCRVQQAAPKHFQETLSLPEKRTRRQRTLQTGILLVIDIVPVCVCVSQNPFSIICNEPDLTPSFSSIPALLVLVLSPAVSSSERMTRFFQLIHP